jgi:predicted helicase
MSEARISYFSLQDFQGKDAKLEWLERVSFEKIEFENINPDGKGNWINLTDNDFDSFLPLVDKEVKAGKSEEAIFKLFSRGIATQRDEWVYDFSKKNLIKKVKYLVDGYMEKLTKGTTREFDIKWDRGFHQKAGQIEVC